MTGIQYFLNLSELFCSGNQLTALDLSQNPRLNYLECFNNQLTALDLSQNPSLYYLECYNNLLTDLDLSQNPGIVSLHCSGNQLTDLVLSQQPSLSFLDCSANKLTDLDISKSPELRDLYCSDNQLAELCLSDNLNLSTLECRNNLLTALDLSNHQKLSTLECQFNNLESLKVSGCPNLTYFHCQNNLLTKLDLSECSRLSSFYCEENQLSDLALTGCPNLEYLYCQDNQLTALDVTKCLNLKTLYCQNNQLATLDLSNNSILLSSESFVNLDSQHVTVAVPRGDVALSEISKNLTADFIENLQGATLEGDKLTNIDFSKDVTYQHEFSNAQGSKELTVTVHFIILPQIEISIDSEIPYTGDSVESLVKVIGSDYVKVVYHWLDNNGNPLDQAPVKPGTYKVYAVAYSENDEYSATTPELTFTIKPEENAWTEKPSIASWTYGDPASKPVGSSEYGTVEFSFAGEDGIYSSEVPTNAGKYKMKAVVAGTDTYAPLEAVVEFEIRPKDMSDIIIPGIDEDTDPSSIEIKDGDKVLVEGKDYEIEKDGNTVTFRFINNYTGEVSTVIKEETKPEEEKPVTDKPETGKPDNKKPETDTDKTGTAKGSSNTAVSTHAIGFIRMITSSIAGIFLLGKKKRK